MSVAERRRLRAEIGLPSDGVIVVLAGQVAEVKGLWDYLDAASIIAARGLPISFAVLGDDLKNAGALREKAEGVVRERGLGGVVKFLGFKPNAPGLMGMFDVVAVPSHVEPLGLAALEGMAAGCAVVGSRIGGIRETVVDGTTGTLVPPHDPDSLADAIQSLAGDRAKTRAFGAAGRRRVLEMFSIERHVASIQAIYDGMLGAPSRYPAVPARMASS
jgi:glycosyltransferase involved in cell wall biosynthesis